MCAQEHGLLYTLDLRGSEGEGAKARSKARTKFLVEQERAKIDLDHGATSLACSITSHDRVSYTLS